MNKNAIIFNMQYFFTFCNNFVKYAIIFFFPKKYKNISSNDKN